MNQAESIFMPGLTSRGPVYRANAPLGAYLSGMPALPPTVIYGAMAAALFLGYKKVLPFGIAGGAALAFGIYELFPSNAVQGSGAPTAADIAASTTGINQIQTDVNSAVAAMSPSLSGFFNPGRYNRKIFRR